MPTSSLTTLHRASNLQIINIKSHPSSNYERTYLKSESPTIPSPTLFKSLYSDPPNANAASLPTISECAAHLELLQVFNTLRLRVLACNDLDDTFGIKPDKRTVYRKRWSSVQRRYVVDPHHLRDPGFAKRRLEKWPHYLGLAVTRFKAWVKMVEESTFEIEDGILAVLPPLDVLMVWHAFLLNPRDFETYCNKHKLDRMRKLPFPWRLIHEAIDSDDWTYHLPEHHVTRLQSANLEPDLLKTLLETAKSDSQARSLLSRFSCTKGGVLETFNIIRAYNKDKPPLPRPQSFLENVHSSVLQSQTQENKSLIDQIQRQVSFIEKMDAQLWIRSPAVQGTLQRAIERYDKFLQLLKLYPNQSLVPTLDVDLVWHTHQCSAARYRDAMLERVGRFVNHDDRVAQAVVKGGLQRTGDIFSMRFGQKYQVCLCWDCEAIVDAVEKMQEEGEEGDAHEIAKNVAEEVVFYREVEVARRMGKELPFRCHVISSWRVSFWTLAVIYAIFTGITAWTVPRDDPCPKKWSKIRQFDVLGTLLIVAGIGCFSSALTLSGEAPNSWRTNYVVILLVVGVALLVGFIFWQSITAHPLMPLHVWKERDFSLLMIIYSLCYMGFAATLFYLPLYLQRVKQYSALVITPQMLPLVCSGIVTSVICALHLVDQKLLMGLGGVSYIAAFLLLGFMDAESTYWAFVFPTLILLAVGVDLHYNIANIYVMSSLPPSHQSIAGGIFSTATKLLSNIALGIATSVFTSMNAEDVSENVDVDLIRPYLAVSWFAAATAGVALCFVPFLTVRKQSEGTIQIVDEEYEEGTNDGRKGECEDEVKSV